MKMTKFFKQVENIEGKGEIARDEQTRGCLGKGLEHGKKIEVINLLFCPIAQSATYRTWVQEVAGSIPGSASIPSEN